MSSRAKVTWFRFSMGVNQSNSRETILALLLLMCCVALLNLPDFTLAADCTEPLPSLKT
jgi:hypothetical protein